MLNWESMREVLSELVTDSKSCTEVLEKLKLRKAGANYKTLRKYLNMFNISTAHFDPNWWRISNNNVPLPDDAVFVENSNVQRSVVKNKIITRELIPYICAGCGIVDSWNGKHITLHLEHKNGIANDHRLSNLEFLCPNCHSQTSSYAGRNNRGKFKDTIATKAAISREKREIEARNVIDNRIAQILSSGVVIGKWGWMAELSRLLNIKQQPLGRWIKKHAPVITRMAEEYNDEN